ncbi:alpha/beta fold hydrolase [Actinomadura sp. LOL_016]|uniref:alpha/beta fold hydrolase n=1 Tax=unclassified Actinomadura TaxID=2626254 RepID=UPI003A80EB3E
MPEIELSAGPIDYQDTGGDGPVLVFGHGLPMNEKQWRKVVPLLPGYRCVLPTLPMGGHRRPMRPDADLSQAGMALLLGEFIDRLGLDDVTLVLNDWGGGQFLISEGRAQRIGRLVLVTCEAFDNFPPGAAKAMVPLLKIPGGARLALWTMTLSNRTKGGYGAMSRGGIAKELMDEWVAPATRDKAVRRDFVKFATGAPDRATLLAYSERLRDFDRPVLVVWATEDKLMPREHGPRLAELYPRGRLVEMADSSTLVPEDQPERLVEVMTDFLAETGAPPA